MFYKKKPTYILIELFSPEQNDVCHNDVWHNTLFERYKLQDIANLNLIKAINALQQIKIYAK